jgi:hypothetical protein
MKDVTEIFDSDTGFTLVSPARTMTIETQTPAEMTTWLRALIESCPLADVSRVRTPNVSEPKPQRQPPGGDHWSKEQEVDYDEYRPLDRDGLLQLNSSARTSRDNLGASGKSFDRSISLFSRNADGDKNSFYFASSGQTQALATLPAASLNRSSDEEEGDGRHRKIVGEGETLEQLGGMQRSTAPSSGRQQEDRDSSRGSRDGREGRAAGGRATGGYGGGDASTSNRLNRHIARDSPSRPAAGSAGHSAGTGTAARAAPHSAAMRMESVASMAAEEEDSSNPFNSASSIQVQRGSPPRPRGGVSPSPLGGIEEVDASAQQERVMRSKAMLRNRQQRSKRRQRRGSGGSDSGSRSGSGSESGSGGDSSSDSERDYGRASRTAVNSSGGNRRRGSREDMEGPGSAQGTPTQRVFKGGAAAGAGPSRTSSGNNVRTAAVPAPSTAPPRRARDALAQEEGAGAGSPGRAQVWTCEIPGLRLPVMNAYGCFCFMGCPLGAGKPGRRAAAAALYRGGR